MARKIFVAENLLIEIIDLLGDLGEVSVYEGTGPITKDELILKVGDADAVVPYPAVIIDRDVIQSMDRCVIIANYAVGYNNIDVKAATERGIMVTNTPGVLTETTADLAWALLLSAARRIVEGDRFVREGKFSGMGTTLFLGQDVYGATLGIIGAGRIGTAVAKRGRGFDMRILYYSRHRHKEIEELGAAYVSLDTLLRESDFISLNVPYTEETHHLIDEDALRKMKRTAVLVNTARGAVVDEKALLYALRRGDIWYAALDVYENEPLLIEGLTELQNVVLTPHIGSASYQTRLRMGEVVAKNIEAAFKGLRPPNLLNPEVLKS